MLTTLKALSTVQTLRHVHATFATFIAVFAPDQALRLFPMRQGVPASVNRLYIA